MDMYVNETRSDNLPSGINRRNRRIVQVFGYPFKSVVHEKFGDGIMSAIDYTFHVEKEEDPKGDRVKVTMSGKFLPYKKF